MDDILKVNGKRESFRIPASAVTLAVLTVILGITTYAAMSLSEGSDLVRNLNYYGRYGHGIPITDLKSFLALFGDSLINALPSLIQIFVLFLLSFSPLLLPAGITVVLFRGILTGIALCKVGSTPEVIQPCFYLAVSFVICLSCASYFRCREVTGISAAGCAIRKTAIFLISSGAAVAAELVLSFVM